MGNAHPFKQGGKGIVCNFHAGLLGQLGDKGTIPAKIQTGGWEPPAPTGIQSNPPGAQQEAAVISVLLQ